MKLNKIRTAAILAGGLGTRLGSNFKYTPKSLIKIFKTPLVKHQILLGKKYNIKKFIIVTGYKDNKIKEYLGNGIKLGVEVQYVHDRSLIGTSNAISLFLKKFSGNFYLFYGDIFMDININKFYEFHINHKSNLSMVVQKNANPYDSDKIIMNKKNQINKIVPKRNIKSLKNNTLSCAAFFILNSKKLKKNILKYNKDFVSDYLRYVIQKKQIVYGYKTDEYLRDIGTIDRIKEINKSYRDYLKFMDNDSN